MFNRPSVTEKLAHGKNLSPKLAKLPKTRLSNVAPPVDALVVDRRWSSATLCVTELCVIESTSDQPTPRACVPTPPTFGLPASVGKLGDPKLEPPPSRKQEP